MYLAMLLVLVIIAVSVSYAMHYNRLKKTWLSVEPGDMVLVRLDGHTHIRKVQSVIYDQGALRISGRTVDVLLAKKIKIVSADQKSVQKVSVMSVSKILALSKV